MTVSDVKNIIGDRFNEKYGCGSFGKYFLNFEHEIGAQFHLGS